MLNCGVCSLTPFSNLFGFRKTASSTEDRRRRREYIKKISDVPHDIDNIQRANSTERHRFRPRSPEETIVKTSSWKSYLSDRVISWTSETALDEILLKIAAATDKEDDPILGGEERCVFWHGESVEDEQSNSLDNFIPVVRIRPPGEQLEKDVSVRRILAFFFADDESFKILEQKKSTNLESYCGEKMCINLAHIEC